MSGVVCSLIACLMSSVFNPLTLSVMAGKMVSVSFVVTRPCGTVTQGIVFYESKLVVPFEFCLKRFHPMKIKKA